MGVLRRSFLLIVFVPSVLLAEEPLELQSWLGEQEWMRDTEGPILSLGSEGEFDETHMFAPAVANTDDRFQLWYCGSRGKVAERVFSMGLATSSDGRVFESTPTTGVQLWQWQALRPDAHVAAESGWDDLLQEGKLRMWFSSTWFEGETGLHTLHETASVDGVNWSAPSEPRLEILYAPSVLKVGDDYRMWYTDVSAEPWKFRHASSHDGRHWKVTDEPVMIIDQAWEKSRLFYPTVLKVDDAYLMWYGSYWTGRENTTALGFAVSQDGLMWHKHPANPVLRPDPERPWESHYVTSQSVMRLDDGSFRMWYASRKQPPFVNKYFAINTAVWVPK
ncbi:MAG: hypothetical protein R3B91_17465 [Planctomycetaceae bacterium]